MSRVVKSEESASKHINILTHYDDETLMDKNNKLIKIIKLSGLNFVTKDEQTLDAYKIRRNNLLKNFSSEYALYFWDINRKVNQYPGGSFPDGFAKEINNKYINQIEQKEMFHKEHYVAVMTKTREGLLNQSYSILNLLNFSLDKNAKVRRLVEDHKNLSEATNKIMSALSDYDCELLGVYEKNGIRFSAPLAFISELINFNAFSVPLKIKDVRPVLARKRLFFNNKSGTIELRAADNTKKFAAIMSIKAYTPITYQGILDGLTTLRCEYVVTQSYRFYDRQNAKARMRDQQKEMMQSKDESITQTDQIDEAFDDAASGEVGYGKHHFTLTCYADSQEQLNKYIADIVSQFSDVDISCVREDVACELGFWSQLPGNFGYIARAVDISTKNMAAFASLHNYAMGSIRGNHWGEAVTVFETLSGSPYFFNFHYKDVGNFLVFGAMGSGKTVLVGFLIAQSMKFGGKRIIFDKDRGLEILVRALGGIYETIKPGKPTGFNPCLLDDTVENRQFLSSLFRKMLSVNARLIPESDNEIIEAAIQGMYRLQKSSRQLCHIASFFGTKKKDSLRGRFDQWHSEGVHAWLFDNENDSLNLNPDVLGFDLGHLLSENESRTPALMYLTYRVEQAIEGHRGMLFGDEGWRLLSDDYFKERINDWSRTPRKKDNIFGLATQVANDIVDTGISKAINESAFCKIFFPNPSADRKVYIDDLGLTEHEYHLVKTLPDDQHYFLLNHGRGVNKQSVVIRANLSGLEDEIAIISAREKTLALLDQIRAEVGDDPKDWLPLFLKQWSKV